MKSLSEMSGFFISDIFEVLRGSYPPKADISSSLVPASEKVVQKWAAFLFLIISRFLRGSYPPKADISSSLVPATNEKPFRNERLFLFSGICIVFTFYTHLNMTEFISARQQIWLNVSSHTINLGKRDIPSGIGLGLLFMWTSLKLDRKL